MKVVLVVLPNGWPALSSTGGSISWLVPIIMEVAGSIVIALFR